MIPFTKSLAVYLSLLCMTASFAADLFEDKVVAKGKGFVINESDVDKAFIAHKAAAAAMGHTRNRNKRACSTFFLPRAKSRVAKCCPRRNVPRRRKRRSAR